MEKVEESETSKLLRAKAPQKLTLDLIRKTYGYSRGERGKPLDAIDEDGGEEDLMITDLLSRKVLRLEWCSIKGIENLEIFTNLKELYLQFNRIPRIEGLDTLLSLEILSLASNEIRLVENLKHLQKLKILDLNSNQIETIFPDELPASLQILDLRNNACSKDINYQDTVVSSIRDLQLLDGERVHADERRSSVKEITLQIPVIDNGAVKIVPLKISGNMDMYSEIEKFCKVYDIEEGPEGLMERIEISFAPGKTEEVGAKESKGFLVNAESEGDDDSKKADEVLEQASSESKQQDGSKIDDPLLRLRHHEEDHHRAVMEASFTELAQERGHGASQLRQRAEQKQTDLSSGQRSGFEGSRSRIEEARRFVQEQQARRKKDHKERMELLRRAKTKDSKETDGVS